MANLANSGLVTVIAARSTTSSTPDGTTDALFTGTSEIVRTLVTYSGTVTAAVLRLWIRNTLTGTWHKGATSTDVGPLAPTSGNQAIDWFVGPNVECTFTLESISQSGGGTVRVDAVGVDA